MLCGVRGKLMLAFLLNDRENSSNDGDWAKQHDLILYGRIRVVQTHQKLEHTVTLITFRYGFNHSY
jgi:hypothetical protein